MASSTSRLNPCLSMGIPPCSSRSPPRNENRQPDPAGGPHITAAVPTPALPGSGSMGRPRRLPSPPSLHCPPSLLPDLSGFGRGGLGRLRGLCRLWSPLSPVAPELPADMKFTTIIQRFSGRVQELEISLDSPTLQHFNFSTSLVPAHDRSHPAVGGSGVGSVRPAAAPGRVL